jgi:hypothetical protein
MTGEPQTTRELYDDIIARRGGAERFSPEQLRLVHALSSRWPSPPRSTFAL